MSKSVPLVRLTLDTEPRAAWADPLETKEKAMQFMLLMIPKGYETAKPGTVPTDAARVAEMMKFNQALKDAGVLVSLNGLHPVSAGARVSFAGGKPTVIDGPFVET